MLEFKRLGKSKNLKITPTQKGGIKSFLLLITKKSLFSLRSKNIFLNKNKTRPKHLQTRNFLSCELHWEEIIAQILPLFQVVDPPFFFIPPRKHILRISILEVTSHIYSFVQLFLIYFLKNIIGFSLFFHNEET